MCSCFVLGLWNSGGFPGTGESTLRNRGDDLEVKKRKKGGKKRQPPQTHVRPLFNFFSNYGFGSSSVGVRTEGERGVVGVFFFFYPSVLMGRGQEAAVRLLFSANRKHGGGNKREDGVNTDSVAARLV